MIDYEAASLAMVRMGYRAERIGRDARTAERPVATPVADQATSRTTGGILRELAQDGGWMLASELARRSGLRSCQVAARMACRSDVERRRVNGRVEYRYLTTEPNTEAVSLPKDERSQDGGTS